MDPCYSGFQVQGTATSPAGMAPSDASKLVELLYYNKYILKKQYLLNIFYRLLKKVAVTSLRIIAEKFFVLFRM